MSNPEDAKRQLTGDKAIAKVRELLPRFRSAMMLTQTPTGDIHVRPLALQGELSRFGGVLWFFTDVRSRKVTEAADGAPVSLICQNDEQGVYLHLTGRVTVARDLAKMRELYSPRLKTWFPKGLDDPCLTLVKFEAAGGAYWDTPGGLLHVLASFAKSVATGTPGLGGETGELHL
jgi:general stress protein 26